MTLRALRCLLALSSFALGAYGYGCSLRSFDGFDDAYGRIDAAPDVAVQEDVPSPPPPSVCEASWTVLQDLQKQPFSDALLGYTGLYPTSSEVFVLARPSSKGVPTNALVARLDLAKGEVVPVVSGFGSPGGVVRPEGTTDYLLAVRGELRRFDGFADASTSVRAVGNGQREIHDLTTRGPLTFALYDSAGAGQDSLYRYTGPDVDLTGFAGTPYASRRALAALGGVVVTSASEDAGLLLVGPEAFEDGGSPRVLDTAPVTALASFGDALVYATDFERDASAPSARPRVKMIDDGGAPRLVAGDQLLAIVGLAMDERFLVIQTDRDLRVLTREGEPVCSLPLADASGLEAFRDDEQGPTVLLARDAIYWVSGVRLYRLGLRRP